MISPGENILARIVESKRSEIERLRGRHAELEREGQALTGLRRDFAAALRAKRPAVIAEIKRASPSKGALAGRLDPALTAREYESGGAAALSVLTERNYFLGCLEDLAAARQATALPVLRKDFIVEEVQVAEAAAWGADAILLIAALLDTERLRNLRQCAASFGMAALVEVHDEEELERAVCSGAEIIGVNNRDLRTFQVTLETSLRLAAKMPQGVLKVSESGIESSADIRKLLDAGFDGFLVGEYLIRASDRRAALEALLS